MLLSFNSRIRYL